MFDLISQLIDSNIYNKKHALEQFGVIAETLTGEYVDAALDHLRNTGTSLSLYELMNNVSKLHNELKLKAMWCKDAYRHDRGRKSMYLGRDCTRIIKKSVTEYIRRVKMVDAAHRSMQRELMH